MAIEQLAAGRKTWDNNAVAFNCLKEEDYRSEPVCRVWNSRPGKDLVRGFGLLRIKRNRGRRQNGLWLVSSLILRNVRIRVQSSATNKRNSSKNN
jgi:hypothetical protein